MSNPRTLRFFVCRSSFRRTRKNGEPDHSRPQRIRYQRLFPLFFVTLDFHKNPAGRCPRSIQAINRKSLSILLSFLFLFSSVFPVVTEESFFIPESTLERVAQQYGKDAGIRLESWQQLIQENEESEEIAIIEKVNTFFNRLAFISDKIHWQKEDYWATPIEFLITNGGDCEDFSIAKYFTLKALGIDEKKLNITYVKSLKLNQAHMVLTFFKSPDSVPLVIDNLTNEVLPASQRADLIPIYSFNGTGLWLAKQQGRGKMIGSSLRLKRWQETLTRMNDRSLPENMRLP